MNNPNSVYNPQELLLSEQALSSSKLKGFLHKIPEYYQEAYNLTAGLSVDKNFSGPELADYLNSILPDGWDPLTRTKIEYLRTQNILNPIDSGKGEIRGAWRYSKTDARRALLVEFLKARDGMNVQEIKGRIQSFEELMESDLFSLIVQPENSPPNQVELAYVLLRNRVLGTLITTLGRGNAAVTPRVCFIAFRVLNSKAEMSAPHKMNWIEVESFLNSNQWYLAASFPPHKLYLYRDLQELSLKSPDIKKALPSYYWYTITFSEGNNKKLYEIILGLPEQEILQPEVAAIQRTLEELVEENKTFPLDETVGLSTLLRCAFPDKLVSGGSTNLNVFAEIVAEASDVWDYCSILTPEGPTSATDDNYLVVKEGSSRFPSHLLGRRIEKNKFLSGWSYAYGHPIVVNSTVDGDPRIGFYNDEKPTAAAAVPAIADVNGKTTIVGVVYVGRYRPIPNQKPNEQLISRELIACLEMLGLVCGDVIARDNIEVGSVRSMAFLCNENKKSYQSFSNLEILLKDIVNSMDNDKAQKDIYLSWVHFLTIQIQISPLIDPRFKEVVSWIDDLVCEITKDFLTSHIRQYFGRDNLPVGYCKVQKGKFVFAILKPVILPEKQYKDWLIELRRLLTNITIPGISASFYPWGVSFAYPNLYQNFAVTNNFVDGIIDFFCKRIGDAIETGPNISRGHDNLRQNRYDDALREFQDALVYSPKSQYLYKHLAETYMLISKIDEAIENCQKALEIEPRYLSARCLLADCFAYKKDYERAVAEYEKMFDTDILRPDFLTRYGIALACMPSDEYQNAYKQLNIPITRRESYLAAIEKLEKASNLNTGSDLFSEENRRQSAEYRFHRGFAHLSAGLMRNAIEDFAAARRLIPDDLRLSHVYMYVSSKLSEKN